MKNAKKKRDFIIQLFLYYKPLLTKKKQIELLDSWISSCAGMEEFEMASTLKKELYNIEAGIDTQSVERSKVINTEGDKILPLKKRGWNWINLWEEKHGFTFWCFNLSIIKREFKFIVINYGFEFSPKKDIY